MRNPELVTVEVCGQDVEIPADVEPHEHIWNPDNKLHDGFVGGLAVASSVFPEDCSWGVDEMFEHLRSLERESGNAAV